MKNTLTKTVSLVFSSFLIFILHLPFVFARTGPVSTLNENLHQANYNSYSIKKVETSAADIYNRLNLNERGLSEKAFTYALKGYNYLKGKGKIINENIISIVDFTKSSSQKRMFIIDLKNYRVLFNTYVAHGQGSGSEFANEFSNIPESLQSSLGFYVTSGTYIGKHGYSMYLNGIEAGINDKANERAIVLHGAPYVSEDYIRSRGYIGRSWGCPAVPEKLTRPIIEKIKNGSCLFIYGENRNYLNRSGILNS